MTITQQIARFRLPLLAAGLSVLAWPLQALANDYPTEVVADYVVGCMATNGETADVLRRCSCSIDTISSVLTYDNYEKAETVMRMRMVGGENTAMFRSMGMLKEMVDQLRLAQIEADFRCF